MGRSGIVFNLSLFNVVPPVLLTVLSRSNTVQVLFLSPVPVNISKFINLKWLVHLILVRYDWQIC